MSIGPKDLFQHVFEEERMEFIKKPKKKQFIGEIEVLTCDASIEELQDSVEKLVKKCENEKLRLFFRKYLSPVVNAIEELSGTLDGAVSAISSVPHAAPMAIAWGSLKFVIKWAKAFSDKFEQIQSQLEDLSEYIYKLAAARKIYSYNAHTAPAIQRIIARSYKSILAFWYRVTKELRRKALNQLVRAPFSKTKIDNVLKDLKSDAFRLESICNTAESELQAESRGRVEGIEISIAKERVETVIERIAQEEERKLSALRWKEEKEHHKKTRDQLNAVVKEQQLAKAVERSTRQGNAIESMKCDDNSSRWQWNLRENRDPGTCEWLFKNAEYLTWRDMDTSTPVFWLYGIHGAGKSTLCSAAIDRLREGPDPPCLGFQYIRKGQEVSRGQLLRNIAAQLSSFLVDKNGVLSDLVMALIEKCKIDSARLEHLLHHLFIEAQQTCIFIDGLDEIESQDVQAVVVFLIQQVNEHPRRMKLWCSSQFRPKIQEYIEKAIGNDVLIMKELDRKDTERDIKLYLTRAIPGAVRDATDMAQAFIEALMGQLAGGSFLWAFSMVENLKRKTENEDDMIELALEGLPDNMEKYYENTIKEYRERDGAPRNQSSHLPLWKILLSFLTFSKRPLRLDELRDAISIVRTEPGHNLRRGKLIRQDRLLSECAAFVQHIKTGGKQDLGVLVLSHNAVYTFLEKRSGSSDLEDTVVSPDIVGLACLRYLSQPRYSQLLTRHNHSTFLTSSVPNEDIDSHPWLRYTAKYWYRHCDEIVQSSDRKATIAAFLLSPNMQTCVQIQSITVVGHFMLNYSTATGEARALNNNLPRCTDCLNGDMESYRQNYQDFLEEWCQFLQLGLTSDFNGEIDRCFWRSLGMNNFTRYAKERYKSAKFELPGNVFPNPKSMMMCQSFDVNGNLLLCRIEWDAKDASKQDSSGSPRQTDTNATQDLLTVMIEKWSVYSVDAPRLIDSDHLHIPALEPEFALYCQPHGRKRPLLPRNVRNPHSPFIAWSADSSCLRIGSRVFRLSESGLGLQSLETNEMSDIGCSNEQKTQGTSPMSNPRFHDLSFCSTDNTEQRYCEDVVACGKLLIKCRRQYPRNQTSETTSRGRHVNGFKSNAARTSPIEYPQRYLNKIENSRGYTPQSPSSESSAEPAATDSGSGRDSSRESSRDGSQKHKNGSQASLLSLRSPSLSSSTTSQQANDDLPSMDDSTAGTSELLDLLECDDESVCSSGRGGESLTEDPAHDTYTTSDLTSLRSLSSPESSDSEMFVDVDVEKSEHPMNYDYPVEISDKPFRSHIDCDGCDEPELAVWFQCKSCGPGGEDSFDLCYDCFTNGKWCYDETHKLYEYFEGERLMEHSWSNFVSKQEIRLYNTSLSSHIPIFSHSVNNVQSLHESAPIRHPHLPLVVWPICAEKLFILNCAEKPEGTLHKMRTSSKRASQVSVSLAFSPCGTNLYVGSVEALPTKKKHRKTISKTSLEEVTYNLSFHVTTVHVSPTELGRHRLENTSTQSHKLGPWTHPLISTLPYTWTWTPTAVYFSMTGFCLRVFRIPLHCPPSTAITTPSETIFLPRSAMNRSVHFLPRRSSDENPQAAPFTLIIGPRHGSKPGPPIVIFFSEKDLGAWVDVAEKKNEERIKPLKRKGTGMFEEFDSDDCDVIPFG